MNDAQNPAASRTRSKSGKWLILGLSLTLAGCALPNQPAQAVVYDFGPAPVTRAAPGEIRPMPALMLEVLETNSALDSTAVLYRLAYVDQQQIRPYALARWSMTPAQLLRQRLRQQLSQRHALLNPGDSIEAGAGTPVLLQLELEEFSQYFESADHSSGLLHLRATLSRPGPRGATWLAQRSLLVQREAATADAPGGVHALTAAADAAAQELDQWLHSLGQ